MQLYGRPAHSEWQSAHRPEAERGVGCAQRGHVFVDGSGALPIAARCLQSTPRVSATDTLSWPAQSSSSLHTDAQTAVAVRRCQLQHRCWTLSLCQAPDNERRRAQHSVLERADSTPLQHQCKQPQPRTALHCTHSATAVRQPTLTSLLSHCTSTLYVVTNTH